MTLLGDSVSLHPTAADFLTSCLPWLMRNEGFNNGIISTAIAIRDDLGIFREPYFFSSMYREQTLAGCAIRAEPDGLQISGMPGQCATALANTIIEKRQIPQRVSGEIAAVTIFVRTLFEAGLNYSLEYTWNIYATEQEPRTGSERGFLRLATPADGQLIENWGRLYAVESPAPISVEEFLLRKLREGQLYIWDAGGPQAIASVSAPTPRGIRISSVYTPTKARGRGFAYAIVSELTKLMLNTGHDFVTLSAIDGHNSERIYRRLGFSRIGTRLSFIRR